MLSLVFICVIRGDCVCYQGMFLISPLLFVQFLSMIILFLGSGHYLWVGGAVQIRGGINFSAWLSRGGGKNVVRGCRGGAIFECEQFSDLHRPPPPPVNNDRSLIIINRSTAV